MDVDGVKDSN